MSDKKFVVIRTVFVQRVEQFSDGKLGNPELLQTFSYLDKGQKPIKSKQRSLQMEEGGQEFLE